MASRRVADLLIKIGADNYELIAKFNEAEKKISQVASRMQTVGKSMSVFVTAPLMAMAGVAVKNADTQVKAEAKVQQAIKSTGGAAKLSFEQLKKYASQLQGKSIFGDEKILNDATAQLLTFTNIAGENFKRAQQAALDVSTVLDGDLKSAAIQLGKALNDPVKNLSALSRSGIQFSKSQTAVIKSLAETNRLSEAQSIILSELERQYGGQAEAAAKVGLGPLQQLKNSWGDFLEIIGTAIMPALQKLAKVLQVVTDALNKINPATAKVIVTAGALAAAIGPVLIGISSIIKLMPMMAAGLTALSGPIGIAVTAVTALGAAFLYCYQQKQKMYDEMANQFAGLSTSTLERMLKENRRLQAVNENENPWQGSSIYSKLTYRLNKGDRREALQQQEKALLEAIQNNKKALEEQAKAEAEAKKITDQLAGSMKELGEDTKLTGGVIGDLNKKISELEKKKLLPGTTKEDIAAINDEIKKLQKELKNLNELSVDILDRKALQNKLPEVNSQITLPQAQVKAKINMPQLKNPMLMILEEAANVVEGTAWGFKKESLIKINKLISECAKNFHQKGLELEKAIKMAAEKVGEALRFLDGTLQSAIGNTFSSLSQSFGRMFAGDLGLGGLLNSIGLQLGNFITQLGESLMAAALEMIAFRNALVGLLATPWLALGVGAAMVATGTAITVALQKKAQKELPALAQGGLAYGPTLALIGDNRNARIDPEVVAPLSMIKNLVTQNNVQHMNLSLGGEFRIKGRDLVLSLSRENLKMGIMGV